MQVYLVGGAVRDEQLGLPVTERDWCVVGATPAELTAGGRSLDEVFARETTRDMAEEVA